MSDDPCIIQRPYPFTIDNRKSPLDPPVMFHEMDVLPLTPEQQERMDFTRAHWRTNSTDTGLEWTPCGPDCTHQPE